MDLADDILLVMTLEMTAIKDVKLYLEVVDKLNYPTEKVKLVLEPIGQRRRHQSRSGRRDLASQGAGGPQQRRTRDDDGGQPGRTPGHLGPRAPVLTRHIPAGSPGELNHGPRKHELPRRRLRRSPGSGNQGNLLSKLKSAFGRRERVVIRDTCYSE